MKPECCEEKVRKGDVGKNWNRQICAGAVKKGVVEKNDKNFSGFRPSDLGDVSLGDSPPGLGGSSSRS